MIQEGSEVRWDRSGSGQGKVKKVFFDECEVEINGLKIKKTATREKPLYLIELGSGKEILKNSGEIYTVQ